MHDAERDQERLDPSVEGRASQELVMHILKLRWMGMEREAEQAEAALQATKAYCAMPVGPLDTD